MVALWHLQVVIVSDVACAGVVGSDVACTGVVGSGMVAGVVNSGDMAYIGVSSADRWWRQLGHGWWQRCGVVMLLW